MSLTNGRSVLTAPTVYAEDENGNILPVIALVDATALTFHARANLEAPFLFAQDDILGGQVPLMAIHPQSPIGAGGGGTDPTALKKLGTFTVHSVDADYGALVGFTYTDGNGYARMNGAAPGVGGTISYVEESDEFAPDVTQTAIAQLRWHNVVDHDDQNQIYLTLVGALKAGYDLGAVYLSFPTLGDTLHEFDVTNGTVQLPIQANDPAQVFFTGDIPVELYIIDAAHNFLRDAPRTGGPFARQAGNWVSFTPGSGGGGRDGTQWFNGNGAPTSGIGGAESGDYYLDGVTGNYYKLVGTGWVLAGTLKGAPGAAGLKGDQGDKGDKGDTGDITPELQQLHDDAQTYASNASDSANAASASASAASGSQSAAAANATAAQNSAGDAATSAAQVQTALAGFNRLYLGELANDPTQDGNGDPIEEGASYWNTTSKKFRVYHNGAWEDADASAQQQAANAQLAASQAAGSAGAASGSATAAANSATAAAGSATTASQKADAASGSATAAGTSATNAANSASAASGSATAAGTSATNAANSATAASGSASTASTQAGNASASATSASGYATNAQTYATNAGNSATAASGSATAAAGSATAAANASTAYSNKLPLITTTIDSTRTLDATYRGKRAALNFSTANGVVTLEKASDAGLDTCVMLWNIGLGVTIAFQGSDSAEIAIIPPGHWIMYVSDGNAYWHVEMRGKISWNESVGGDLSVGGALSAGSNATIAGGMTLTANSPQVSLNDTTNNGQTSVGFQSGGKMVWQLLAHSAGSDRLFGVARYDTTGAYQDVPLSLDYSTGRLAANSVVATVVDSSNNGGQFRAVNGNYGAFLRNDGSSAYLLSTASGDQYGAFNSFRPFTWDLASGTVTINGNGAQTTVGGNLGVSGVMYAVKYTGDIVTSGKIGGVTNPNLVVNGSAELGGYGWSGPFQVNANDGSGGSGSSFNSPALTGSTIIHTGGYFPVAPNISLTLSAMLNTAGMTAGALSARIVPLNSSGAVLAYLGTISLQKGNGWTYLNSAGVTPAGTVGARVEFFCDGNPTGPAFAANVGRIKVELGVVPSVYSQEATLARVIALLNASSSTGGVSSYTSSPTVAMTQRFYDIDATAGAINVALPAAANCTDGTVLDIGKLNTNTNAVTVTAGSGTTINGVASVTMNAAARQNTQISFNAAANDWRVR